MYSTAGVPSAGALSSVSHDSNQIWLDKVGVSVSDRGVCYLLNVKICIISNDVIR